MKRFFQILLFISLTFALVCFLQNNYIVGAESRSYKFIVSRADAKLQDDVIVGIELGITCERTDLDTGRVGTAQIKWYAPKTEFEEWPPSLAEFRIYVVDYLKTTIGNKRRLDRLIDQADEPVISHQQVNALIGRELVIE